MKKNVLFFSPTFYDLPLNENIKKRSKFRPVAPVTLKENADKYFSLSDKIYQSYYFI